MRLCDERVFYSIYASYQAPHKNGKLNMAAQQARLVNTVFVFVFSILDVCIFDKV